MKWWKPYYLDIPILVELGPLDPWRGMVDVIDRTGYHHAARSADLRRVVPGAEEQRDD